MFKFLRNLFSRDSEKEIIDPDLPPQVILDQLQPEIEKASINCIKVSTQKATQLPLNQNKFGGVPYFPKKQDYPTGKNGQPLRLLAQLNFAEIPSFPPYPSVGLLQFYIADEDIFGMDFDNPANQENFRVLYFEDTAFEARTDLESLWSKEWESGPLMIPEMSLHFETKKDYPSYPCLEYFDKIEPLFGTIENGDYDDALSDLYLDQELGGGHKIGGFPYFTQNEIRENSKQYLDYQLLFQIDSEENKIMWGDVGIANFFIHRSDLEKRNFSKVLYNWDCH